MTLHRISANRCLRTPSGAEVDGEFFIWFSFELTYAGATMRRAGPEHRIEFVRAELDLGRGKVAPAPADCWDDWLADHEDEAAEIAMEDRIAAEEAQEARAAHGQFGVGA